jgi:broad specificity phosphatase PhoE
LAVEPGFREMHFGLWEGQTPQALMTACPDLLRNFWADPLVHPPPGAEPLDAFRARVVDAWLAHVSTFEGRRLLLIVHGGTVRVILGYLQRISDRDLVGLNIPYASVHRVPLQQRGETGPEEQPPTDHL